MAPERAKLMAERTATAEPTGDEEPSEPGARKFSIRMPARIETPLQLRAARNFRSVNGEILAILDQVLGGGTSSEDRHENQGEPWSNLLRLPQPNNPRQG